MRHSRPRHTGTVSWTCLSTDVCCWRPVYIYITYAWGTHHLFGWQLYSMV